MAIVFTIVHVLWAIYWTKTYSRLRRSRAYAKARTLSDTNKRYKIIGYLSYFTHNFLGLFAYWSNAWWLFKFQINDYLSVAGIPILILGTWLHSQAIQHLGENYSPCFDSHLPKKLTITGPYKLIRHPDYLAKLVCSLGLTLMTQSMWAAALFVWLSLEVARSIKIEEKDLITHLPGYTEYRNQTWRMIPYLF